MVKYVGPIKNTNIHFTNEEIQSLNNLINYFKGLEFNNLTLEQDANNIKNCYRKNPGHPLYLEFNKYFLEYLNIIQKQAEIHYNYLKTNNYHPLLQEVLQYSSIPLRYSKTPIIDGLIMKYFFEIESLFQMINVLMSNNVTNYDYYADYYFFKGEKDFKSLGHDSKIGWVHEFPKDDKEIEERFYRTFAEYHNSQYNDKSSSNIIGNYAELCVIREYISNIKRESEYIGWISRYYGDGFGYDIMLYDKETGYVRIYEVKGSISQAKRYEINLTSTENNIKNYCIENATEYHIIKVFIDENMNRYYYDINTNNNSITSTDGNSYHLNGDNNNGEYLIERSKIKTITCNCK